jgi:hypothetical protein
MCVVELLLVGVGRCDPNYVRLIEAVSYSSTYVSLVYGADSINRNIYESDFFVQKMFFAPFNFPTSVDVS